MSAERLPLHVLWRQQYRSRRYCQNLDQSELNQRIRDIFLGLLRITPEAKVSLPPMSDESRRDMEIWTHVLEEMVLRHGPYPSGFSREVLHSEPFPDFAGDLAQRTASLLSKRQLSEKDVLIKFGKSEHMRRLYENGVLRVSPASYYAQATHNGAVRDDEMSLPISLSLNRDHVLRLVCNPQDVPPDLASHRLDIEYRIDTDYWIYCLSAAVEPRLFVDFDADACVVISDRERFYQLLAEKSARYFSNCRMRYGPVEYVDPLLPATATIDVPISKHFRYKYQREYRCVWEPTRPQVNLPHIDIELEGLREISELIVAE